MTGQVVWLAWSGGGPDGEEAGREGWLAWWDDWQGGLRGMNLWSKECSGVNIIT